MSILTSMQLTTSVLMVMQEVQALVDIADFMHYWSRKGCTLELETEYHE